MSLKSISPRSILDKARSGEGSDGILTLLPFPAGMLEIVKSKAWNFMRKPPLDPDVADAAPTDQILTVYDEQHVVTYMRLLEAENEGADWKEVARIVLHVDPEREPDRARYAYLSHLERAKWVSQQGRLLRGAGSN